MDENLGLACKQFSGEEPWRQSKIDWPIYPIRAWRSWSARPGTAIGAPLTGIKGLGAALLVIAFGFRKGIMGYVRELVDRRIKAGTLTK